MILTIGLTLISLFFIAYNEAKNSKLEPFDLYITASFYGKYDVLWSGADSLVKLVVISREWDNSDPVHSKFVYRVLSVPKYTPAIWIKFIIWVKY